MSDEALFLGSDDGNRGYRYAVEQATEAVVSTVGTPGEPFSGMSPDNIDSQIESPVLPEEGQPLEATINEVTDTVLPHSVRPSDRRCAAHLHCPPMIPGLVAEQLLTAVNQSLDSFDQAPAATVLEERVVRQLCELFGLPSSADGVFTSGGTQSNFQALLLARDRYCARCFDTDIQVDGMPPEAGSLRILSSEAAHFTAKQAAHYLGLGEDAVVTVSTDDRHRIDKEALDEKIAALESSDAEPFALVGTAGTTDFGSVDPLASLAERAADRELWFHVDAAYGGALAVSNEHGERLEGIERADSIAVDFHKLFYQPISCGAFLLRTEEDFRWMARNAAYLNPEAHENEGVPNLVTKSVQTTRRFDALKPYVAFRTLGRSGMAELVDQTLELAHEAAALVADADDFELLNEPALNVVVFRYRPDDLTHDHAVSRLNAGVREELLADGRALVARTEVDGITSLKFTLMNPKMSLVDVAAMLDVIRDCGSMLASGQEVST